MQDCRSPPYRYFRVDGTIGFNIQYKPVKVSQLLNPGVFNGV